MILIKYFYFVLIFLAVFAVLLSGCVQQQATQGKDKSTETAWEDGTQVGEIVNEKTVDEETVEEKEEEQETAESTYVEGQSIPELGNCKNLDECMQYCSTHFVECMKFCGAHPEMCPTMGSTGTGSYDQSGKGLIPEVPEPPAGEVSVYKGFWMPCGFWSDTCQPMSSVEALTGVGANVAVFGPTVKINSKGEAKFDSSIESVEMQFAKRVKAYYEAGIRVILVIELFYEPEFTAGGAAEPKPLTKEIYEQPGFMDEYNALVEEMAKLAEKYNVDMFSPLNEPDFKFDQEFASKWGQEILPIVRKHFSGKLLYKAAFYKLAGDGIDFKGYDAIGMDPSPGGGSDGIKNYPDEIDKMINNALTWSKRDNVFDIMFTEFGVWGGALSFDQDNRVLAHRIVFEHGKGKVKGFIALDPPPDLDKPITGTKVLEEIKTWFKEKLE